MPAMRRDSDSNVAIYSYKVFSAESGKPNHHKSGGRVNHGFRMSFDFSWMRDDP